MADYAPRVAPTPAAAHVLEKALGGRGTAKVPEMTIADAATRSGLPLWDAERALHALVSEYRGHLRVTEEGELLFKFPTGLTKPWETRTKVQKALSAVGRGALGVARFVVRAWIAIVLVAYVAIFVAILLGLTFAGSSNDNNRSRSPGVGLIGVVFRVLADAMFWTFHPFSPFAYTHTGRYRGFDFEQRPRQVAPAYGPDSARALQEAGLGAKVPFYEKVNRFFFGPQEPEEDERAVQKKVLAELRAQKGRIGLGDVMRVTGLPRDQADPLMARLMLEYAGTVEVSEEGGIVYRFADIRKTAADPSLSDAPRPGPVWSEARGLSPLTGNSFGTNLLIVLLNGFNLVASLWALGNHMTIDRVGALMKGIPWEKLPAAGTAWALGIVPLVFSILLFAIPALRALWRPFKVRREARERGRRAVLREVLESAGRRGGVSEAELKDAYELASGTKANDKELTREVVALGGDVDMANVEGGVRYRFPELEAEARAVEAEREAAAEDEARVGQVVFSSEN
ncbi:MAG: hypothetical protein R3B70_00500 [Polyangiaceae bacterium]